ncbi:MAG TPA: hypothetical protein VFH66_13605 [Mycobacteriales bacterium]|nr:hypothetical protein [Mycobacteriales bacterium]
MRRQVLVATATLVAAGCGTTVSGVPQGAAPAGVDGLSAGNTAAQSGTASSTTSTGPATGNVGSAPASSAAGSAPLLSSGSSTSGATTGVPTGGSNASADLNGPGVTDKAIYVGVDYTVNGDAANAALGASSITSGNEKADAQAVIDDINAHGGVAGRKLVPVFHATDAQSTDTTADQDQAECADFTQDHHVFAALGVGYTDNYFACLFKSGAIDIDSGVLVDPDDGEFRQYPYYFEAGTISQDRIDNALVPALQRQHYFNGWDTVNGAPGTAPTKVGVLGVDTPTWNRPLDHVLLPALKAAGYPVAASDVVRIYNPGSQADDGKTLSDISSAVLKFRQDGVTHVILLDTGGQLVTFFGQDANSQHYYPRFGVHSGSGLQAIYDSGIVPKQVLNGAMGFAWNPTLDLSASAADKFETPATKYCLKVMKDRTGQTFTSTNAASIALSYCDMLYLLRDGLNNAGGVVNRDTVRAAIERLRGSFQPALFPQLYYAPGRHDGVQVGWDIAWDSSCTCAKFTSAGYQIADR